MTDKVNMEWEYLIVMGIVAFMAFTGWYYNETVDWIHAMYAIGGVIVTAIVIITCYSAGTLEVGKMPVGNLLMQTAAPSLVLGLPMVLAALRGSGGLGPANPPLLNVLFVGTTAEEIIRIAAYLAFASGFGMPKMGAVVGGIVFAAIHVYWMPTDWINAIVVGILFSIMIMVFNMVVGCVISHFSYDALAFGYINVWVYVLIFLMLFILGYIVNKKTKVAI